jgi:protein-tyrosine phosphatase
MDAAGTRNLRGVTDLETAPVPDDPQRHLPLTGAFNFRDLGGYLGAGGRRVRWRTLFRADGLSRLHDEDLVVLGELGMRSVLDLRTGGEVGHGRVDADALGWRYHHLSVLSEEWEPLALPDDADAAEVLGSLYVQMLDEGAEEFAAALRLLADERSVPAVFHCAAGKDRTGVLAALVLGLLGVDHHVIVEDYSLSGHRMEQLIERLKAESPEALNAMNDQPAAYWAAPPDAMARLLRHIDAEYGSIASYTASIGAGGDVADGLRATLLT